MVVGNVSANVCAKFRCSPLHTKKALGIFGGERTDYNNKKIEEELEWLFGLPPTSKTLHLQLKF